MTKLVVLVLLVPMLEAAQNAPTFDAAMGEENSWGCRWKRVAVQSKS